MTQVTPISLDAAYPDGAPPATLKWYRNGIAPPATGGLSLANRLNTIECKRLRHLCSYANVYGLHANFAPTGTTTQTCHRFAFHTGPTTQQIAWSAALLPAYGSTTTANIYVQVKTSQGLTGAFTPESTYTFSLGKTSTALSIGDVSWGVHVFDVTADTDYRITVDVSNLARIISTSVYEVLPLTVDTSTYTTVNDTSTYFVGAPITNAQVLTLNQSAEKIWKRGHPFGWWTIDQPGDERSRTTNSLANLWDQTVTTPTATSPGWVFDKPFSGSMDSPNIPIVFWAYADCVSGTGSVKLVDQNNAVISTLAPAGAAAWYSTTGNLQDSTNSTPTTKVDVMFQGDGTHACKVYACGAFMYV